MVEQISTHRRSTTAAALRRGQIKISEPVPLENSGPSPIWKPSSSHRQMRHPSGQHPNQPFPSDNITGLQGTPSSTSISTGTDPLPAAPDYPSGPMGESSMPMSAEAASHAEAYNNRSIQPQNVAAADGSSLHRKRSSYFVKDAKEGTGHRPDSVSGGVSFQPRPSITDSVRDIPMDTPTKKKRRSGSIRGAFRRMFSKREKQTVNPEDPQRMRGPRHEYHTSEPALFPSSRGGLERVYEEGRDSPAKHTQRKADHEAEFGSGTPVDTRLPFPMNINGAQPAPYNVFNNDSKTSGLDGSPQIHRRRATLPSIVLSPTDAAALSKFWDKGDNGSVEPSDISNLARTPTPLIGLAITSNASSRSSKRRSRSADALRELAHSQQSTVDVRRRSAELQYWRNAQYRIPEVEEAAEGTPRSQHASVLEVGETPSAQASSEPRTSYIAVTAEIIQEEEEARNSIPPAVQQIGDEPEQVVRPDETLTRVDNRLSQLESNISHLERSMQALSSRQPTSFKLEKPPRSRGRVAEDRDGHELLTNLSVQSRDELPARASSVKYSSSPKAPYPRPSPSLHDINVRITQPDQDSHEWLPKAIPHDGNSPLPSATQFNSRRQPSRGSTTPPNQVHNFSIPYAPSKDSPSRIIDQLAPLYSSLQYERSVRKQLEITVLQLQRDLLNLTNIVAEMRGLNAYPTPSPDHLLGMLGHRKTASDSPPGLVPESECDDLLDTGRDDYTAMGSPNAWATPRENTDVSGEDWNGQMF